MANETSLDKLDPRFKAKALVLLEKCEEIEPIKVIETLRSQAKHEANLKAGTSWIKRSKHQDGLAIDICPVRLLPTKNWSPEDPVWLKLGEIGESLGLRWGGRWRQRDLVHFEYVLTQLTIGGVK